MTSVDVNADLAEGDSFTGRDREVLAAVTSVSVACGFHAGNRSVMREAAEACLERGVVLGAHVSYPDRDGFGRRPLERAASSVREDVVEQCGILGAEAAAAGATIAFVKPHGALYHRMGHDEEVAEAVVGALSAVGIRVLVAPPGTAVSPIADRAGVRLVAEGFPDRGYLAGGRLAPRDGPGAMVDDPGEVGRRAVSLAVRGGVDDVEGRWTPVAVETLCVHGDEPSAAITARAVRAALEDAGVMVRPFVDA